MSKPVRVLIDLMPLVDKVRFELALEMGALPDEGLADVLEQIAKHDDYSEEVVTAALRSALTFAVLEGAALEVARRAERSFDSDGTQNRTQHENPCGVSTSNRTVAVQATEPQAGPLPDRT